MDWYAMSDKAIVREMGKRLRQLRLHKNISQKSLALKTGIHRVTISKIETGQQLSLITLVQILRGLEELERFEAIIPPEGPSPLQLAKLQGKQRKRASRQSPEAKDKESEW
jgi:transcriptional regulator with XRE-family HTH domain